MLRRLSTASTACRTTAVPSATLVNSLACRSGSGSLFRRTSVLLSPGGLMKRTHTLLIPPIVARVIAGIAMVVLQSLWDAHRAEAAKLARQYGSHNQQAQLKLTAQESLTLLGMDTKTKVPLSAEDQQTAKKNFESLFEKAEAVKSPYLQGKFSGAYRTLVDSNWDAKAWDEASQSEEFENNNNEGSQQGRGGGGGGRQ